MPLLAAAAAAAQALPSAKKAVKKFENGFEIHSTKMGDPHGKLAKSGKKVWVKYVGRLKTGKVFDKTDKKPFQFRLGEQKRAGWAGSSASNLAAPEQIQAEVCMCETDLPRLAVHVLDRIGLCAWW